MQSLYVFAVGTQGLVGRSHFVAACRGLGEPATPGWRSYSQNRFSDVVNCLIHRNSASRDSSPQELCGCLALLGFDHYIGSGVQSAGNVDSSRRASLSPIVLLFSQPGRPGGGANVLQIY